MAREATLHLFPFLLLLSGIIRPKNMGTSQVYYSTGAGGLGNNLISDTVPILSVVVAAPATIFFDPLVVYPVTSIVNISTYLHAYHLPN